MTEAIAPAGRDLTTASTNNSVPRVSKAAFWSGWIISGLVILWMAGLGILIQVFKPELVQKGMADHGYPAGVALPIFIVELVCVLLYAIPRTAVLGAILTTGLLGAALAANLRVDNPLFSHTLFSIYLGIFMWVALWLREPRIRGVFPLS